ncbi:type IV pilin accessory protein [Luteimonas rhizosphaerae]|nr:type IV pilin accessory protein [Luteimonas sp. 4-12]
MTRWKAAATHLLLSIVVIGGIAITAFLLWYPYALHRVAGLDRVLLVMLAIDLTAGPLLTLIVYREGKPSLRFDLAVIALCQIAFLGYGLHTLWQGRPVFLVGTPEVFTLVFANEISDADLARASRPEWRRLSWTGPQLVGTRMPDDPAERSAVIEAFMAGGAGIERTPGYYRPYPEIAPALLKNSTPAADSVSDADIRAAGDERQDLRQVPILSRRGEGAMLLDPSGMPRRTTTTSANP